MQDLIDKYKLVPHPEGGYYAVWLVAASLLVLNLKIFRSFVINLKLKKSY
jgi:hypothetical protein